MFEVVIAALLTAAHAAPAAAQEKVTIVVDQSAICGSGRTGDYWRAKAEARAQKLAEQLRGEGKEVEIKVFTGGSRIGTFGPTPGAPIVWADCR